MMYWTIRNGPRRTIGFRILLYFILVVKVMKMLWIRTMAAWREIVVV